jgi:hypothetical protein
VVDHFGAFYYLYKDPAETPNPAFEDLGDRSELKIDVINEIRGTDYTCIAATATAEE